MATRVPAPLPPLEGYTFEGYRNPDGSVGTKNILAISISVQCVAGTLDVAIRRIKQELLPRYPNVDDVVGLTHAYGCGVAINAPEAVVPIRTLQSLAQNPNFGGEVMVVGLGCEKLVPERLLPDNGAAGDGVVRLQDERHHGFSAHDRQHPGHGGGAPGGAEPPDPRDLPGLRPGGRPAMRRQRRVLGRHRQPGVGLRRRPAGPLRRHRDVLRSDGGARRDPPADRRAPKSPEVAEALIREMAWYDAYLAKGEADRSANPTPGNKKGGLNNIVEKALGSVAKSGTSAISGVLAPGERVREKGLIFAATPASDFVCGTLQLASGITLQVFTTGRGTPYGLAQAPVIKVATRTELAERWSDLIDLDAGRIATGDGDDRGGRLGAVPPDPRRGERPQAALVRPLGAVQRPDAVQPGADHLRPGRPAVGMRPRGIVSLAGLC